MSRFLFGAVFSLIISPCWAEDRLEMEGTSIRGNRESPQVLYIVPWQAAELPDLSAPPLERLIDEALAPVEREEFQRQIQYYNALASQPTRQNENQ